MTERFDILGFVDLNEVNNIFTNHLTKIEEDLRLNGTPGNYRLIIEWFDNIHLDLRKRAKFNLAKHIRNNPEVKAQLRENKEAEQVQQQPKSWQERIEKNRARAKLGEE